MGADAPGEQVKVPAEQKIIREILSRHAKHESRESIARDLARRGIATQRGGGWRGTTVREIIAANTEARSEAGASPTPAPALTGAPFVWGASFDPVTEEYLSPEELKGIEEQAEALRRMTVSEKADRFRFCDPEAFGVDWQSIPFAGGADRLDGGVSEIVEKMTEITGRSIHALIGQISGQPGIKGPITRDVNRLLRELTIQRQANLSLRQEVSLLRGEASRLTGSVLGHDAAPAAVSQPAQPAPSQAPRTPLTLGRSPRKSMDPQ